jgi:hypothetical protein
VKSRSPLFTRQLLLLAGVLPAAACSFPDVSFDADAIEAASGSEATGGGETDDTSVSSPTPDATVDASVDVTTEAAMNDVTPVVDTTLDAAVDATVDAVAIEDNAVDAGMDGDGATEALVPNCTCTDGSLYPVGVMCGALGLGVLCADASGFSQNPACGEAGDFVTCVLGPLTCAPSHSTRVQQCH